jgi:N4-gp56 family major capsid protein
MATNPPYSDLPQSTNYHTDQALANLPLPSGEGEIKSKIWSELVKRDAREKNIFRDFMGDEGGGKPIAVKRDLSAGGNDRVTFTTTTPIRGQGVLGESQLKGNTDRLRFGAFQVEVDLVRHAVSYTQVLKLLRFTGKTLDQLSAELMAEWAAKKSQDECMIALRNSALNQGTLLGSGDNVYDYTGNTAFTSGYAYASGHKIGVENIESSKQHLMSNGASAISVDADYSGADIPQYLLFGPDTLMRALRRDDEYLQAVRYSQPRGDSNPNFKGSYPLWESNMIHVHNIMVDTADGRQGSPFAPRAYLGAIDASATAAVITDGSVLTGGGTAYGTSSGILDYFANFLGFDWGFTTSGDSYSNFPVALDGDEKFYATVYDLNAHEYVVVAYDTVAADGSTLTVDSIQASSAGGVAHTFPTGSIIFQSTADGSPLQFGLHTGGNALYYAVGSVENEPIYHFDDFATAGNRAHLTATGIQSVRGLRPYQDTIGRYPNFMLNVGIADLAGVTGVPSA